jgi:hypothetical protein
LIVSERHVVLLAIDAPLWCAERRRGALEEIISCFAIWEILANSTQNIT